MKIHEFANEIFNLIRLKQEGGYWDFKREWYKDKSKMLHDIICMANNLENRNAYIIVGIDEEVDYSTVDVCTDANRRNTQQLIDFLRSKDFAGNVRPTVYVQTVSLQDKEIDVIVIKNDRKTPYYLKTKYQGVFANHIYIRVVDTNTPINASADRTHIEYLWKKNFHLDADPLERVTHYLAYPDAWDYSPVETSSIQYYKCYPEYTIEIVAEYDSDGHEYYLFNQSDHRPRWYSINIRHHQTMIASFGGVALDGGRYFTSAPCTGWIYFAKRPTRADLYYKFFIKGSLEHIIHDFYYDSDSMEAKVSRERFLECVLVFESEKEKTNFDDYIRCRKSQLEDIVNKINEGPYLPYFPDLEGYKNQAFRSEYVNALALLQMLSTFRRRIDVNDH